MCTNKYSSGINPNNTHFLSGKPGSNVPLNILAPNIYPKPLFSDFSYSNISKPYNPYGLQDNNAPANRILLTPAIFGGLAAFSVGFGYFGHNLTSGYSKVIFFVNIYAIIATFGVGYYIYELVHRETGDVKYNDIILPVISITLFYAAAYNLIYSLYPSTFTGTIGDTPITQFLSFVAKSIGAISVGETFNVTALTTGTQVLAAIETLFNFFVITLLIALLA